MSKNINNSKPSSIKHPLKNDLLAGVIVFLIALPLCLGIAQASGAPLFSGVIAGIIGGIVIGFLSRSALSVSGPAAGLAVIVQTSINDLGGLEMFGLFLCAVVIAGFFQLVLGFLRAGTIANFFPTSVIEGMLAGIGLTIIFKQIPDAFGYDISAHRAGIMDGERGIDWDSLFGFYQHVEPTAIIISLLGIAILALFAMPSMKKYKLVPAGLLVVLLGIGVALLNNSMGSEALFLEKEYFVQLFVPTNTGEFFSQFALPTFSGFLNPAVWQAGAVIAIVASIETLLCIEATDKLDPLKRFTSGNAELKAQGIGNMLSGLIGGLPITSVIVRSSANINAGGRTKRSAIFHGVLLLVCVATIPALLNYIPKAALAAILIFTGYRLARPAQFVHMYKVGRTEFIPFLVTTVAVALPFLGLLKGVALGIIISIFYLLRANMRIPYFYRKIESQDGTHVTTLKLAQEVSFLNKGSIKMTLESFPKGSNVVIDASQTEYIDFDVVEIIREFHDVQAPLRQITVSLVGFKNIYKVPETSAEAERLAETLISASDSKRYGGKYRKLLKELKE